VALDWRRADNFVAKRYKRTVPDSLYYADVTLQMDAKQLGELYNKTDPPKKIDVMQVSLVRKG
jgi:elongation factor 2 kinase